MNERIKELAEQATTKQEFYPAGCNGYPEYLYYFNKEKFAELIVNECIKVIDDKPIFGSLPIKEHFGVKQ
jgi:hypothetical protein